MICRAPYLALSPRLIADKAHIHMNSTKWDTLTTFVKYLGKQGHCLVDETEKGWFVQFIDRSYLKRKEELDKCVAGLPASACVRWLGGGSRSHTVIK